MAEIAVSFLLEKLASFLQNEVELLQGIPEGLEYIKDELQSLKATLRVADSAGESNQELKVWVQQLREIAYDTEDILDEYKLDLVNDYGDKIDAFLHNICCFTKKLESPASDCFQDKCDQIQNQQRICQASEFRQLWDERASSISTVNPWMDRRGDALLLDSVDLVGIEKFKEQLIDWLVARNPGRKVVSVVGMGGVWENHLGEIEDLLRNMARQLFDMLVLDDVWRMNEWEMLDHALANNGRGSCVLPTTRNSGASTSCGDSEDKDSCPAELERHSRLILEKCEGLPLAIVAISGVLATKRCMVVEWEMVYRGLSAEMEDNSRLINFKEVLLLSFNDLPSHLKSCFLYLSLFPGNHLIENMRLIRLWIEEGDHDNALIMELGKLVQLRRLGITNLRKEDGNLLCSSIEKLINLRALSIVSSVKDKFIDLQSLSSQVLQRLYLYGRLENLPDWIPCLQSLAVIYLKWSRLPNDALQSLQNLPNLVHLELVQAVEGDTSLFEAGRFKGLKQLGIDKFEGLKCIEVEGAIPCLEKLSIQRCKLLERVPLGIEHLTNLKVLKFFDMPEELIMARGPDANVPEVCYTYWRNGEWEVYIESSSKNEMSNSINTDTLQSRFK
ncbi:putative Nbs-lrr resistance protein [Hibiscus syriacus]|uniref:Nbs-lrr resistance protein n=1 Tax=Hibiscus syriacus TaxID=106335 RepID=A0A6A2ZMF5_HIBSY|nr:putative Nbs-lrr resistance protein [Hibiscus syriacus]